jgi:hypothetical protein
MLPSAPKCSHCATGTVWLVPGCPGGLRDLRNLAGQTCGRLPTLCDRWACGPLRDQWPLVEPVAPCRACGARGPVRDLWACGPLRDLWGPAAPCGPLRDLWGLRRPGASWETSAPTFP